MYGHNLPWWSVVCKLRPPHTVQLRAEASAILVSRLLRFLFWSQDGGSAGFIVHSSADKSGAFFPLHVSRGHVASALTWRGHAVAPPPAVW